MGKKRRIKKRVCPLEQKALPSITFEIKDEPFLPRRILNLWLSYLKEDHHVDAKA